MNNFLNHLRLASRRPESRRDFLQQFLRRRLARAVLGEELDVLDLAMGAQLGRECPAAVRARSVWSSKSVRLRRFSSSPALGRLSRRRRRRRPKVGLKDTHRGFSSVLVEGRDNGFRRSLAVGDRLVEIGAGAGADVTYGKHRGHRALALGTDNDMPRGVACNSGRNSAAGDWPT